MLKYILLQTVYCGLIHNFMNGSLNDGRYPIYEVWLIYTQMFLVRTYEIEPILVKLRFLKLLIFGLDYVWFLLRFDCSFAFFRN